jgi:hypothetical protein
MKLAILATLFLSILGFVYYDYSKKSIEKEKTIVENVGIPVFKKGHKNPIICKTSEEYYEATKGDYTGQNNVAIGRVAIEKMIEENAGAKKTFNNPKD